LILPSYVAEIDDIGNILISPLNDIIPSQQPVQTPSAENVDPIVVQLIEGEIEVIWELIKLIALQLLYKMPGSRWIH